MPSKPVNLANVERCDPGGSGGYSAGRADVRGAFESFFREASELLDTSDRFFEITSGSPMSIQGDEVENVVLALITDAVGGREYPVTVGRRTPGALTALRTLAIKNLP